MIFFARSHLKQGIEVVRNYDPELPPIEGYGSELNQVWTNLIDNAADALLLNDQASSGQITLRTHRAEISQSEWVVVTVEDNGPGILEEVQTRLFEPFFTTKAPGVGSGMGLDISYNIVVNKHRGEIKVQSEPGKTQFEVWLPVNFESQSATAVRGEKGS